MRNKGITVLILAVLGVCLPVSSYSQTGSFEHAMALFRQRNWKDAAAAFAEAERAAPGKTDALLYRGKSLINLGDFQNAAGALTAYRSTHPQSDDCAYLLGFVLFRENKPRESLEMLNQAAKLKTPTGDDLKTVALDYALLNDYVDAARYLEEALRMDPGNVEARYHLGRVYYQQNKFDPAMVAFQGVLLRDPNHIKAQNNLGLCLGSVSGSQKPDGTGSCGVSARDSARSGSAYS